MNQQKLLKTGIIGAVISALCCFTPVLYGLLGVIGLSAVAGYLDYVLIPALMVFVGIIFYALWKRQQAKADA